MQVQLERIVIFNFKSFKGKVIIGPIKPFTVIMGPNGSGKSNIMDAIGFVMGEKAKNLRVKQLNDLIYGTSTGEPISDRAYVTAVFTIKDNNIKTFTRSIHRTVCEYKVDDQVVVAQVYISELGKLNLNIKAKHFLIFQGAIDSTMMKTPKEYTCMFEEVSNSIELKSEYERLKNEIIKGENGMQYLYKRKKDLFLIKKCAILDKQEASKYEMLHNQYLDMKTKLYLFELFYIQKDMQELEVILNDIELKISECEHEKDTMCGLLKEREKQLKTVLEDLESIELNLAKVESNLKATEAYFTESMEKVSYWEQKLNSTNLLLLEAQKSNKLHVETMKELENELVEIENTKSMFEENMATQLLSQGSSIELNDIQVKEYYRLKQTVEVKSLRYVQTCSLLKRDQDVNQNKLDNENRKKYELETALYKKTILKEESQKRIRNIEKYICETQSLLIEKTNIKYNLEDTIAKRKAEVESMQQELQYVSEQLDTAKVDKYTCLRLNKEAETIKVLQSHFPGVYGRLYNLCKPIHSRYDVAMTKVLGKYYKAIIVSSNRVAIQCIGYLKEQQIATETFLPVDNLRAKPVEDMREILKLKTVKFLYDLLQFAPAEISNAILFATKNAFVCETPEDARLLAYEFDAQRKNNCVAIDGTYYTKQGLISGGQVELILKAKVWQEQGLVQLKSQKMMLREKLNEITRISQSESEMNTLCIQIESLRKRLDYCRQDLSDAENKMVVLQNETEVIQNKFEQVNENVKSIQKSMEEKYFEIDDAERSVLKIEDSVFKKFCKKIGITNIRQYEQGNLRLHQEQTKRQSELEEHYSRVKNLLDFERNRDTESPVFKMEKNLRAAKEELEKARRDKALCDTNYEHEIDELNNLKSIHNEVNSNVNKQTENINKCRSKIGTISKSILKAQKELILITTKIKKGKLNCHSIFTNSKMEDITIPLIPRNNTNSFQDAQTPNEHDSTLYSQETHDRGILSRVDFSKLSEDVKGQEKKEIDRLRNKFSREIEELQNTMVSIKQPNFKAGREFQLAVEKLREINVEYQESRKQINILKRQFEEVKQQRYNRFSNCLEHIATELDFIFKCLLKDQTAQAILLSDNPEEPYLGGINYSCIMPGKRFHSFSYLSGGEKALAVLAFLFAVQSSAPFFVFDEIDAALDVRNIKTVVQYVRSKAKEMQFIIISLAQKLFSHADALIGICSDNSSGDDTDAANIPRSVVPIKMHLTHSFLCNNCRIIDI